MPAHVRSRVDDGGEGRVRHGATGKQRNQCRAESTGRARLLHYQQRDRSADAGDDYRERAIDRPKRPVHAATSRAHQSVRGIHASEAGGLRSRRASIRQGFAGQLDRFIALAGAVTVVPPACTEAILRLDPDPNPVDEHGQEFSSVMLGGRLYRYYRLVDGAGRPLSGTRLKVQKGELPSRNSRMSVRYSPAPTARSSTAAAAGPQSPGCASIPQPSATSGSASNFACSPAISSIHRAM